MLLRAVAQRSSRSVYSLASTSQLTTSLLPPLRCLAASPRAFHLSAPRRLNLDELPRDEKITARQVSLVDYETGKLSERTQSPATILRLLDRTRFWLVQVTDEREVDGRIEPPLCKLVNKQEAYEKQRIKKAEAKAKAQAAAAALGGVATASGKSTVKEVSLSWSSTPHDMNHKLQPARQFMFKKGVGSGISVKIVTKKGKGVHGGTTPEGKAQTLADIEAVLCKPMTEDDLVHVRRKGEPEWKAQNSMVIVQWELARGRPVAP